MGTSPLTSTQIRPRAVPVAGFARELGIPVSTAYYLLASGYVRSIRLSPRRIVVPCDEIDRLLADPPNHQTGAEPASLSD